MYNRRTDSDLNFEWDEANIEHIGRHDVRPEEVEQFFFNDPIDLDFEVVDGEDRWTAMGHTNDLRTLVVVWTMRDYSIRVVTAVRLLSELVTNI